MGTKRRAATEYAESVLQFETNVRDGLLAYAGVLDVRLSASVPEVGRSLVRGWLDRVGRGENPTRDQHLAVQDALRSMVEAYEQELTSVVRAGVPEFASAVLSPLERDAIAGFCLWALRSDLARTEDGHRGAALDQTAPPEGG